MIRAFLIIAFATLAACSNKPECTNHNPILDQNGYTTPQYKDELLKQIHNTDPAKLHYWIDSYKEIDGKPFALVEVQSDNLCGQMLIDLKNPNKMKQFKNVKGVSYRGVEITGLQYMVDTTGGKYNFVFEEGKIRGKKQ